MPVNTNLHKYKNSCDSSKDSLDTKILSRFSKLPDKNLSLYTQVPLVCAFNVWANGYFYVSWEINRFLKSFRVVSIKNAGFSKLETWFSRLKTRFIWGSSIVPVLSHQAMLLLSLPNLSRKIEVLLLTGYKLINNNNFKDRSFQWYLILGILKNPVKITR